jgi:hypothetical protein
VRIKLPRELDERTPTGLTIHRQCATASKEEDSVVRGIAIVSAMMGALVLSSAAAPVPAQAGLASAGSGCDPYGGRYPGYAPPYAYTAYYYGYPPDCGGLSITFYFPSRYDGDRYVDPRYQHHWHHRAHRR